MSYISKGHLELQNHRIVFSLSLYGETQNMWLCDLFHENINLFENLSSGKW